MKKLYIIIAILAAGLLLFFLIPQKSNAPTRSEAPAAPAPQAVSGAVTLAVGEKGQVGDLGILLKGPIEDSRCPIGVQCVWAGEVRASVLLSSPTKSETISIANNKPPYIFDGHQVTLVTISPSSKTPNQKISQSQYQITFQVQTVQK